MNKIFILILILSEFSINSFGQKYEPPKGNISFLPELGISFEITNFKDTYYAGVNGPAVTGEYHATISYFGEIMFRHMITNKIFYQTGLSYINRKSNATYNLDTIIKYTPNEINPVIERNINNHNIELPILGGVNVKILSVGMGLKILLGSKQAVIETKLDNSTFKTSDWIGNPLSKIYPSFFANLRLNKKVSIVTYLDLRSKYDLDLLVGINYHFKK